MRRVCGDGVPRLKANATLIASKLSLVGDYSSLRRRAEGGSYGETAASDVAQPLRFINAVY